MPKKIPSTILFKGSAHLKDWQRCYDAWQLSLREHSGSAGTARVYHVGLRRLFADPRRAPDTYTQSEIAAWIRTPVVYRGVPGEPSANTRNQRLCALRSFYEFA